MTEEADPRNTARHPRRRSFLIGHEPAERFLLGAYRLGRLHHAWLIGGPRGIGKATFAYRFARFLLRYPHPAEAPGNLDVEQNDPVFRRVAAGAHSDLFVVERELNQQTGRLKTETGVDIARMASRFFSRSAGGNGWRVCIVDTADDLNEEAANSLLKILEEPPANSVFLLISNRPGMLLKTIRSRCVGLSLNPLLAGQVVEVLQKVLGGEAPVVADIEMAAELSGGSPGRALELLGSGGTRTFAEFHNIATHLPRLDRKQALSLAEKLHLRAADDEFAIFCQLLDEWIAKQARTEAMTGKESALRWAKVHQQLSHSIRQTNALNLDRRQLVMHAFEALQDAARHSQN
jgi:DNA polymerase-3 subunit delta'